MAIQSTGSTLRKRKRLSSGDKLAPYFYISPALLFLGLILGFPIIYCIVISFQNLNLTTLISKQPQFIGFQNYYQVLTNPEFKLALIHSLVFTFFSILFQFTFGLGLAILFSKAFPLNNVMSGFCFRAGKCHLWLPEQFSCGCSTWIMVW